MTSQGRLHRLLSFSPSSSKRGQVSGGNSSRLAGLERKKRPIFTAAIGYIVAISIVLAGVEGWSRAGAYSNRLHEGEVAAANTARAAAEHAEASIDVAASILSGLVERVETDGTGPLALPRLHRHLMARVAETAALQGLFIYDETGRWAATSLGQLNGTLNNADRDYFKYHREHADRAVRIGAPIQSRSSNVWVLPVSRRLDHADGSFAGVALAAIKLTHFQRYYDGFDLGRTGAMLLALTNGTLLTRRPFAQASVGSNVAKGPVFALMRDGAQNGTQCGYRESTASSACMPTAS